MTSLERKALLFAAQAHTGQTRHGGITPYIIHPLRVVARLREIGVSDPHIIAAGYLHDVKEDCGVSDETLCREFGPNVACIVAQLSRDIGREEYKERIRKSCYSVQIVKLADVADNTADLRDSVPWVQSSKTIDDCTDLYLPLAQALSPQLYAELTESLSHIGTVE